MAVTKIWAIHDSVSRVVDYCSNPEKTRLTDLEQVLIYAANKAKTLDEGEQSYAVTGVNCRAETAAQEMSATQRRFGKTGGNVAYHAYQSFKTGEVSAAECHRIGLETARRLWGDSYQVLVATHFNTGTYHNHFVVSSVGMWDGRKLEAKYGVYYALRAMSDRICKEYGLSVVQNPQRHKTARSVYFAEKNGEPTRFNLMREALDKALSLCSSWSEMATVLRKLGYEFECGPNHKYATIRPFRSKKCTRTFRLGPVYEKETMRERLLENQRDYRVTQSYYAFLKPYSKSYARENPPTEAYYRKREFYCKAPRITGYVSFFRAVAIVLGVAPMYEKEYQQPLSAECREACRRLDRYTAEMTLVEQEASGDAAGSADLYRAGQRGDRRGDRYPQQGPQQAAELHRPGADGGAQKAVRRLHHGAGRSAEEKENGLRHHRGPPEAPGASGERIRGAAGERPLSLGAGEKHPAAAERSGERGKTV